MRHVDANFVFHFSCGTVDSETSKKVGEALKADIKTLQINSKPLSIVSHF